MILAGYKIGKQLYAGEETRVFRGRRSADQLPVIVKTHSSSTPSTRVINRLQRDYAIGRLLDGDFVPRYLALEPYQKGLAVIEEDFGAVSLEEVIREEGCETAEFLPIAIRLADALGVIHRKKIIHHDVRPHHILINRVTGIVKLTGFESSSQLTHETTQAVAPSTHGGPPLGYISPEQTGRMNTAVDHRTDFYSLGVTFYELLCGQLPFGATDPMELLHSHIAKKPLPPHEVRSSIPPPISEVVMKLLAKEAEHRYQSGQGLKVDLERCLRDLEGGLAIRPFILGQEDFSEDFRIPQKLYGRGVEIQTLLRAFDRAASGKAELLLVAGYSGVGKTSLVNEIQKPITERRGYFTAGKYDQLTRGIPYAAIIQALQRLIRQILAEPEGQIRHWKANLTDAIGSNLQLLVDMVPELELLVGEQPAVPQLSPTEALNRFKLVFQTFVRVLAQEQHPLVIFLDDLQWIDLASLQLLESLVLAPDLQNFLLVGAYRDNEVESGHPLLETVDAIEEEGGKLSRIELCPLQLEHLVPLVADTLLRAHDSVRPLAELVHQKTDGNPFFVRQFLTTLHLEGVLSFECHRRRWEWDLERIEELGVTSNVVDLMISRLRRFDPDTVAQLRLAACIGNTFDLDTLAVIGQADPEQSHRALYPAVAAGLLLPLRRDLDAITLDSAGGELIRANAKEIGYRFLHDRVQQAAYALIEEDKKAPAHLEIGQLMLKQLDDAGLEGRLFDVVNHLNRGAHLLESDAERKALAELNVRAGKKAKASTAYTAAAEYFQTATELLGESRWNTSPDDAVELEAELGECHYLCGTFDRAQTCMATVLERADSRIMKARVRAVLVQIFMNLGDLEKAEAAIVDTLELFGHRLPRSKREMEAAEERYRGITDYLEERTVDDILHESRELGSDDEALINFGLASNAPAYFIRDELHANLMLLLTEVALRGGTSDCVSGVYMGFAIYLSKNHDFDRCYEFGRLALALDEKFGNLVHRYRNLGLFGDDINFWKHHVDSSRPYLSQGFSGSLSVGDVYWATIFAGFEPQFLMFDGTPLEKVLEELDKRAGFVRRSKDAMTISIFDLVRQSALNLQGQTKHKLTFSDGQVDEQELAERSRPFNWSYAWFCLAKAQSLYLFREYADALEMARRAHQHHEGLLATPLDPLLYFYHSLALAAVHPEADSQNQAQIWQELATNERMLERMASSCPENFAPLHHLVRGEMERLEGGHAAALERYARAIEASRQSGFRNFEAIACELAGRLHHELGLNSLAASLLQQSYECFREWGASGVAADLLEEYPQSFRESAMKTPATTKAARDAVAEKPGALSALDVESVLKAAQAISGEIVFEKLLQRLMEVLIENAGAQRGCLTLERNGELVVEAEGSVDEGITIRSPSIPVATLADRASAELSPTILHYVWRTGETVVLDDAARDERFESDWYVLERRPKSILCMPIVKQTKLIGILYLENNLTTGAFVAERVAVSELLASQASIALENALLYQEVRQEVADRRTAEEEVRRLNAELEQRVAERTADLESFSYSVSHDLRAPLRAIHGFSGVLLEDYSDKLDSECNRLLNIIRNNTEQMGQLIDDLLVLSRLGRKEMQPTDINMQELAQAVFQEIKSTTPERKVQLRIKKLPPAHGDGSMIRQVFVNLISNAIKFTRPKKTAVIEVGSKVEENSSVYYVKDNGVGFEMQYVDKLFGVFQRLHTAEEFEGTGVGLALVQRIIRRHGGRVSAEGKVNKGATIYFTLPKKGG